MNAENLLEARRRIAACLMLDAQGNLVQRQDHLNLAGLGLSTAELEEAFDPQERGLPRVSFADLVHLRYLDLTKNALTELPECVCEITGLEWLGLNFNQLSGLPEETGRLSKLKRFYLRGSAKLAELPYSVGFLELLVELDLTGCPIGKLPTAMGHLNQLEHLAWDNKEMEASQKAAWKEGNWEPLRGHLKRLDEQALTNFRRSHTYQTTLASFGPASQVYADIVNGARSLFEMNRALHSPGVRELLFPGASQEQDSLELEIDEITTQFTGKVILVGSQEHGKTCLQRALREQPFIEGYKSTDGMSRERLFLKLNGTRVRDEERQSTPGPQEDIIDLTLWDMGGQEHYQHTHQMFFTPSAVYLVVTIPRQGAEVQKLDEWIELVKRRTDGRGSIIVVSTWCAKHGLDKSITLDGLQTKHGDMVRHLVSVDSDAGTRIAELRTLIAKVVQEPRAKCEHAWLPEWTAVLSELAAMKRAYIRMNEVREICSRHYIVNEEEQRMVVRTGHYTGALLWREDVPAGEDVIILNPDWLCRAVARLLDDTVTRNASGLVEIAKLDRVWRGQGRDGTPGYEPDTYPALIELMEINELAYRPKMPTQKTGNDTHLLITQMVVGKPLHDVQAQWEAISPPQSTESKRVVAFRKIGDLGYESVPDLIYLLIFRLRDFSLGRKDYNNAVHWQNGLLIKDQYGNAGKIELDGDKLRISVRYVLENGLMHSIISRIGVGEDALWNGRGLEKIEFVPCGSACAVNRPEDGLISMDDCVESKKAGNPTVRCDICRKYVNIAKLMQQGDVETDAFASLRQWLEPLLISLRSGQDTTLQAILGSSADNRQQFAQLKRFIQMQVDRILEAFTSNWRHGPRLFSLKPLPGKNWNPKSWVQMQFQITVWCEKSRKPVPFFGVRKPDKSDEYLGTEEITLTREWVQKGRKLLSIGSWITLAVTTGGRAGVEGLASAVGSSLTPEEAKEFVAELSKDQRVMKEVLSSIPDESKHLLRVDRDEDGTEAQDGFSLLGIKAYGKPEDEDVKLLRFLRAEFEKKDPTWGGLQNVPDDRFGRIWAHPQADKIFG